MAGNISSKGATACHADPEKVDEEDGEEVAPADEDEAARKKRLANKAKRDKQKAKAKAKKAAAAGGEDGEKPIAAWRQMAIDKKDAAALLAGKAGAPPPKKGERTFWNTQPVPQTRAEHIGAGGDEKSTGETAAADDDAKDGPTAAVTEKGQDPGPVEVKTVDEVRKEPYDLPTDDLEWWCPDVTNKKHMRRIYELLRDHYVEDDDSMFRFNYSEDFLAWALLPPDYKRDWHIAIVSKQEKDTMVGFISGIPVHIRTANVTKVMCEINFLCVNKHARSIGLAPLLIKEVTRRVNLLDIWQAVYTSGTVLPTPFASCQYWHRSLNPEKLVQIEFSSIPREFRKFSKPMVQLKKYFTLPDAPKRPGLRRMTKADAGEVKRLLEEYQAQFDISPQWSVEEILHWFMPKPGVLDTYVVQDSKSETLKLTDMLSFYTLPSTILHGRHDILKAAYSYYNVPNTCSLADLLNDALILARKQDFDVFNALDIMHNKSTFEQLKFSPGDGHLQYYLYNWRSRTLEANKVGLVLL